MYRFSLLLVISMFSLLDFSVLCFLFFSPPYFLFVITYVLSVKVYFVIFIMPVVLCPVLGSPAQEGNRARGESPAK